MGKHLQCVESAGFFEGQKQHPYHRLNKKESEKTPPAIGASFKYVSFSPLLGEMIQFDSYVSNGLKPPTR